MWWVFVKACDPSRANPFQVLTEMFQCHKGFENEAWQSVISCFPEICTMSNNAEAENGCQLNTDAAELVGINKLKQIETVQKPSLQTFVAPKPFSCRKAN
jgi:hypothetical protein